MLASILKRLLGLTRLDGYYEVSAAAAATGGRSIFAALCDVLDLRLLVRREELSRGVEGCVGRVDHDERERQAENVEGRPDLQPLQ